MRNSISKLIAVSAFILGANASAMEMGKPIQASIPVNAPPAYTAQSGFSSQTAAWPLRKTVMLMNIKLTQHQRELLSKNLAEANIASSQASGVNGLPRQYDRGMNGTPVLDQGLHGTCVTFANTGAIDALLGKGDYVSQLCNLQLGSYFEEKGYLLSGWDGSTGPLVLNQMMSFGIISKSNQRTQTCGGLRDYPAANPNLSGNPMTLDDFKQSSENLNERVYWESLLSDKQRFNRDWGPQAENLLTEVKKALALQAAHLDIRLTLGTLVPIEYCSVGACARYHAENDTWALTNAIKQDLNPKMGAHEMVITGYNDYAIVLDNEGNKHQGLLILRNSWGKEAGDQGNYYMTYDYFKLFALEVQKIVIEK